MALILGRCIKQTKMVLLLVFMVDELQELPCYCCEVRVLFNLLLLLEVFNFLGDLKISIFDVGTEPDLLKGETVSTLGETGCAHGK